MKAEDLTPIPIPDWPTPSKSTVKLIVNAIRPQIERQLIEQLIHSARHMGDDAPTIRFYLQTILNEMEQQ